MTELEGRVALARIEVEKARLLAGAALAFVHHLGRPAADLGRRPSGSPANDPEACATALAHALAVQDMRAAEVKLAMAESALARSLS